MTRKLAEITVLALTRVGPAQRYVALCGEHKRIANSPDEARRRLATEVVPYA